MTALLLALTVAILPCQGAGHHRNREVIREFRRLHPCPEWCATYVKNAKGYFVPYQKCGRCQVDHICPLACCGKDALDNLQWLDAEANRKKSADCSACKETP